MMHLALMTSPRHSTRRAQRNSLAVFRRLCVKRDPSGQLKIDACPRRRSEIGPTKCGEIPPNFQVKSTLHVDNVHAPTVRAPLPLFRKLKICTRLNLPRSISTSCRHRAICSKQIRRETASGTRRGCCNSRRSQRAARPANKKILGIAKSRKQPMPSVLAEARHNSRSGYATTFVHNASPNIDATRSRTIFPAVPATEGALARHRMSGPGCGVPASW
jgi:hypothetical protein